jgi:hypothetical protein
MPAFGFPNHFVAEVVFSAAISLLSVPAGIAIILASLTVVILRVRKRYLPDHALASLLRQFKNFEVDFKQSRTNGLLLDPAFVSEVEVATIRSEHISRFIWLISHCL